ncbi:MAG: hypothetical protein H6515_14270 [Microthrixaceae bacterium]|nr:hypothetical protein [Microthrixaceae bacterium]
MSKKTLAELRASKHVGLPRTAYAACLAAPLIVRLREIDYELDALPPPADPDAPKPRRRAGQADPQVEADKKRAALDDERTAVLAEMDDHLVEVVLTAKDEFAWREWKDAHPPRDGVEEDGLAGCDFDALLAALPEHIITVNDEDVDDETWEWLRTTIAPGDVEQMAFRVVDLHRVGVQVPKP